MIRFPIWAVVVTGLSGCGPSYSPDTYASNAAQQANKVEQGVVVGVRGVGVSAAGTVGSVTGAAAGGIAGSQLGVGPVSAFSALGGSLVGGIGGSAVEHVTADTKAFEYIVRKPNGDLISVTQRDKTPLVLGQKVLVIAGVQARIVPDYTVPPDVSAKVAGSVKAPAQAGDGLVKPAEAMKAEQPVTTDQPVKAEQPVKTDQPVKAEQPVKTDQPPAAQGNAADAKPGPAPVKTDPTLPATTSATPVVAPPVAASVVQPPATATP
jgi:outer membrane lipoprotein SlyB